MHRSLSRLSQELENTSTHLESRLQNALRCIIAFLPYMQTPPQNDEVAQLREQLRHLEQENDDLQSSVRRLEATEEDLIHKLERAEEAAVFVQQELETFKQGHEQSATRSADQIRSLAAKLEEYETVVSCLLSVVGIPNAETEQEEHELEHLSGDTDNAGEDDAGQGDEDNRTAQSVNGGATATAAAAAEQKWIDMVESLRTELQAKTEQLQITEDSYEEFMAASYGVEKALVSENTDLKHFTAELLRENAHLQHLLQTERIS